MHIHLSDYTDELFYNAIIENGYCVIENVLDAKTIERIKEHTRKSIEKETTYVGTKDYLHFGALQACPMYGGIFLDILDNYNLIRPYDVVLQEGAIIWAYVSSAMPPNKGNFSSRIHTDRPWFFKDHCECLAGLILLDDFTAKNGATWVLPKSHNIKDQPSEEYFYENAVQIIAPAGSVLYFNARLWHAGGENKTEEWRYAIAIGMTRPYIKQKFDFPKMIEYYNINTSALSDNIKQRLGFHSVSPKNLDEFYGDENSRTYTQKSEWSVAENFYQKKL